MRNMIVKAVLVASALTVAAPDLASARPRHYSHRAATRHEESCRNAERRRGNNGAVIGGIGGALAGNAIGHSTAGTLIGGGVGAVLGHSIAKRRKGDC